MLCANTTFGMLTDYATTYIMVRSRERGTLYISSAITHDTTNPSLICIIVTLLILAYYDYQERNMTSNVPSASANNSSISFRQGGEGPAATPEGNHSFVKQGGRRNRGREQDDEDDDSSQGSSSKRTRSNDDRNAKRRRPNPLNTLDLLPSSQAWMPNSIHVDTFMGRPALDDGQKVEHLVSNATPLRPASVRGRLYFMFPLLTLFS